MNTKVLFVDDDPNILSAYQRSFRNKFLVDQALGGVAALAVMAERGPFAVIVSDMQMPGMSGVEFLTQIRKLAPDSVRMMLTGNSDQGTAMEAINQGNVFRFLNKPCPASVLEPAIEGALKQYQLITAERQLLEDTLAGSIRVMTDVLTLVEPKAFGLAQKLREYVQVFLAYQKVEDRWTLEVAALLSQIGYVTIPSNVAAKVHDDQPLTRGEREMIDRIPGVGYDLIRRIPRMEPVAEIIHYHQKNYDGSGFPFDARAGEEIPFGARLIRILQELIHGENRGGAPLPILARMQKDSVNFDTPLIGRVLDCFGQKLGLVSAAKRKREIPITDLHVGDRLVSAITTVDGLMVLSPGSEVTPVRLERIRNFLQMRQLTRPIFVEG